MKVLHIAETVKGGVATVLDQLLLDKRVESFCLIPDEHDSEITNKKNYQSYKRTGRNIVSLFNLAKSFITYFRFVKPDIIHIHSSFAGIICRFILLFFKEKPKIIYCPHAFSFLMDVSTFKKNIYIFIEKLFLINTDIIICTSDYERNIAIRNGFPSQKLITIYNSVQAPIEDVYKDKLNLDRKIQILFVGRLDYQKGVDILAKIVEKTSTNFEFTAVGDSVVNRKHKSLLPSNVNQVGWVTRKELAYYYSSTDLVIMPSRWESFGLVAVEANSYGKPTIATNTSSLPEIIKHNINGFLFEKDNIDEAVSILNKLSKNELIEMESSCIDSYEKRFSTEVMLDNVFLIYSKLKR